MNAERAVVITIAIPYLDEADYIEGDHLTRLGVKVVAATKEALKDYISFNRDGILFRIKND